MSAEIVGVIGVLAGYALGSFMTQVIFWRVFDDIRHRSSR